MRTTHKQVKVFNPFENRTIEVDEKIAQLLELLWKAGIPTEFSCQRNSDKRGMSANDQSKGPWVHIEFAKEKHFLDFLALVADNLDESMTLPPDKRVYSCMMTAFWYRDSWSYRISVTDLAPEDLCVIDAAPTGNAMFTIAYHVFFPCKHYPAVFAAVQRGVRLQHKTDQEMATEEEVN